MPGFFLQVRRLPHLFEIVEVADLRPEDMDDYVARIDQDPVGAGQSLDARNAVAGFLERVEQVIGNSRDMTARPAGGDDHVVAQARFSLNVDGDDIFGLGVFQTDKDCVEGAGIACADPGRRRHDIGLLPQCCSQCLSFRIKNNQITSEIR